MGRNGIPMTGGQGSMSKLKGGDVAMWATRTCMDLVGPVAQTKDTPLEKRFRDVKIYQLFEGTAEIQRLVVSRMQAAEYRERLQHGAAVAAEAMQNGAAGNGSTRQPRGTAPRRPMNAPPRFPEPLEGHALSASSRSSSLERLVRCRGRWIARCSTSPEEWLPPR